MPRPLKPTNPYASWTALFGATVQRLRQELSLQPVVTQAEFGRRVHASGSKVSAIERGQVRPDPAFVEACERELPAGGILRAMLPLVLREWEHWARLGTTPPTGGRLPPDGVPPPGEVAATPAELADVAFLEAAADGAVEATELARDAEASDIGAGTLENIDLAVDRLCRSYASAPPALLIPRVQARLRGLRRLHTGRVNLAQRRQLLVAGGWLATLLATLQFDAGDQPAAEDSRDAALQLGKAAGHQEIMAWSFELLAWFALVNDQPRQALDLAQQGLTLAPNTSAGVQLAMQQARVWARLGQRWETEQALRAGAAALARLPPPAHPEDHFAFDAPKLTFYAAMCFTWLHQTEQAEEHARQVRTARRRPGCFAGPPASQSRKSTLRCWRHSAANQTRPHCVERPPSTPAASSPPRWDGSPNSTTYWSVTMVRCPRCRTSTSGTRWFVARSASGTGRLDLTLAG